MSFKVVGYMKNLNDTINNPVLKIDLVQKNAISDTTIPVFNIASYGKYFERNNDWINIK